MKRVEAEGTWDITIRKIVWGVPIALVAIGLLILILAWLQPSYTATVTEVSEISYTPARKMVRGTSNAYYRVMLDVEYNDGQEENKSTSVQFGTTNSNAIPKAGDQIAISRGLSGMVIHPNRNLNGIGGGAAAIGGLFLVLYLLTWLRILFPNYPDVSRQLAFPVHPYGELIHEAAYPTDTPLQDTLL